MKHGLLDTNVKSLIISLRRKGRAEKKDYLVALSDMLDCSRRKRTKVNVFKLDVFGRRHKDKIFLVPGTVLGYGVLDLPVNVYAFKYSDSAKEKIVKSKGIAKEFSDLLKDKIESKDVMIVK